MVIFCFLNVTVVLIVLIHCLLPEESRTKCIQLCVEGMSLFLYFFNIQVWLSAPFVLKFNG